MKVLLLNSYSSLQDASYLLKGTSCPLADSVAKILAIQCSTTGWIFLAAIEKTAWVIKFNEYQIDKQVTYSAAPRNMKKNSLGECHNTYIIKHFLLMKRQNQSVYDPLLIKNKQQQQNKTNYNKKQTKWDAQKDTLCQFCLLTWMSHEVLLTTMYSTFYTLVIVVTFHNWTAIIPYL